MVNYRNLEKYKHELENNPNALDKISVILTIAAFIIIIFLVFFVAPEAAKGAEVRFSGGKVSVAPRAQASFQSLVSWMEGRGYRIKFARGYGHGTVRRSLHPGGMALDINQTSRNRVTQRYPEGTTEKAASLGIFHGSKWRGSPDYGHFQIGGWQGHSKTRTRIVHVVREEEKAP